MSHTPGPWKHETRQIVNRSENRPVHYVRSDHPSTGYYVATCDDYHAGDENEANARLIAACPALLAACERWVNASQVRTYIPERERPAWDELMAATTTAIKLAKEGQ